MSAAPVRVGRVTLAHAVVSLFTRSPSGEATRCNHGDGGPRAALVRRRPHPASEIPDRRAVDAADGRTRGDRARSRSATATARATHGRPPRLPGFSRSSAAEDHDVTTAPHPRPSRGEASSAHRHRTAASLGATVALVAAYYLLPLDHLAGVPLGVVPRGWIARVGRRWRPTRYERSSKLGTRRFGRSKRSQPPRRCSCFCSQPPTMLMAQADPDNFNVAFAHPHRFAVLHGHRLRHGRLRRHHRDQPSGPPRRHRADDPRPGRPRPRDPRVPRRC